MEDDRLELIEKIRSAFKGVTLEDGVSLNMTEYFDSSGMVEDFRRKARFDEREDWTLIPDSTLEEFLVTFCFTDLKGYRFYLPAYMIYNIRNFGISGSSITEFTIYALDIDRYQFEDKPFVEFFKGPQLEAICAFLEWTAISEEFEDAAGLLVKIQNAVRGRE